MTDRSNQIDYGGVFGSQGTGKKYLHHAILISNEAALHLRSRDPEASLRLRRVRLLHEVITGRVIGGKIEVETDLQDGTPVAILAAGDSGVQLSAEEEEELVRALEEIRDGHFVDGHELLRELRGLYG